MEPSKSTNVKPRTTNKYARFVAFGLLLMLGLLPQSYKACNLSSFTVNSLTPVGTDTLINVTICVGGGRTGTIYGANNDTRSFGVKLYGGNGVGFSVLSFSPPSVTSIFGGCTNQGMNLGPQPAPINSHGTVFYIDPGYYGVSPCVIQPFACVTSTSLCGNVNQNCFNVSILVTHLTDSICAFGIEGGGNPAAGCPCSSMGSPLRLGAPLIVWGDLAAEVNGNGILVSWSSLQEFETGTYYLQRQNAGGVFEEIATIPGSGATQAPKSYSQMDANQGLQGTISYRLRFVDQNGRVSYSRIVSVKLPINGNFAIQSVYPSPATAIAHATLLSIEPGSMAWKLVDASGKLVQKGEANLPGGEFSLELDLSKLLAGTYYLQCQAAGTSVTRKVVKL